ncbi:hypothetical protein RCH06_002888 [Polaromonas sp. CG_9.5]|uniref:hypothetical protein n=1 Tax=Polaromonas sp. CG_9.5 TaxID=3071705 RepID=UPI002E0BCD22|nr:hypothetical protein [Polaromonas sp. CG_9.5]
MAYTLTQARPLLNAAELELFEQSRTEPVKRLTPAKLSGAVKRTRTLRDKYRDLYQRQTVTVRTSTPGAVTGSDNDRTKRKADILQEVLERYEARVTLLQGRDSSTTKDTEPVGKAAARTSASQDVKAAVKKTPRAGAAAQATVAGKASKPASTATATAPKASKTEKPPVSPKKRAATEKPNASAGSDASTSADKAGQSMATPQHDQAGKPAKRSEKAPSRKAPTAGDKTSAPPVNAPLDIVPAAKRASPLKQDPTNKAINAHQSSQGRRTQAKRDSR